MFSPQRIFFRANLKFMTFLVDRAQIVYLQLSHGIRQRNKCFSFLGYELRLGMFWYFRQVFYDIRSEMCDINFMKCFRIHFFKYYLRLLSCNKYYYLIIFYVSFITVEFDVKSKLFLTYILSYCVATYIPFGTGFFTGA